MDKYIKYKEEELSDRICRTDIMIQELKEINATNTIPYLVLKEKLSMLMEYYTFIKEYL